MPEAGTAARSAVQPSRRAGGRARAWLDPAVRRALLAAGPPAGALLAANLLWLTAAQASSHNFFRPRLWVRYDPVWAQLLFGVLMVPLAFAMSVLFFRRVLI